MSSPVCKSAVLLICGLVVVNFNSAGADRVFITEFMAANGGVPRDMDGDSSDWLELHNAGDAPVNLLGWHLTDNPDELAKWTFPEMTLAPGAFLVVYASGKDRTQVGQLHTNFELDRDGEYLALVRPDGSIAHEFAPVFPPQATDVSYGITAEITTNVVLALNHPLKWRVPLSWDEVPATWPTTQFDDSSWTTGVAGFGFDTGTSFDPFIETNVETTMRGVNASALLRWSFVYEPAEALPAATLTLQIRYDDGFVAYLNGVELARRHAPASLLWNSTATEEQPDTTALTMVNVDATAALPFLNDGTNVLAIHALNQADNDDDLLIAAQLVACSQPAFVERYFPNSTPGSSNSLAYLGVVADTRFSPDRGFYNAPFVVTLTNATSGATIRYTLDGSTPGPASGLLYTNPIQIETTTTLRAASFKPGYQPSDIDTHTYIFLEDVVRQNDATARARRFPSSWVVVPADYEMDPDVIGPGDRYAGRYAATIRDDLKAIPSLSLVLNMTNLFGSTGIYQHPEWRGVASERLTSLEVIFPDDPKGEQVNCGLRIQGNVSRNLENGKLSFRLLFKNQYGPGQWHYPIFGTYSNATDHFDDLVLRGNGHEGWVNYGFDYSTYVRDTFARETFLAMGGVASHSRWFHLYLNGLYWGIYELVERPDASLSAAYFGGDKDDWDAITIANVAGDRVSNGSFMAWNTLLSLCSSNLSLATNYMRLLGRNADGTPNPALPNYLDVVSLSDYMLLNMFMAMTDWPGNNYWIGRESAPQSTGFKFYPWDADLSLHDVSLDLTGVTEGVARPYAACLQSPEFRMLFADRVQKHLFKGGALYVDRFRPIWNPRNPEQNVPAWRFAQLADRLRRALVAESARWGDHRRAIPLTRDEDWQPAITDVLTVFLSIRHSTLLQQLQRAGLYPTFQAPEFTPAAGTLPADSTLVLSNRNATGTIYFTLDGSDPRLPGDAINAAAMEYTEPLLLRRATQVRARVLLSGKWSALVEGNFYLQQDLSKLELSELMYNPPKAGEVDGDEFEFLELKNTGLSPLDLSGLTFSRGLDFTFTNGTSLPPGQYFVMVRNAAAFAARYPQVSWDGLYTGKLDNNGETLELVTSLGARVFSLRYDNAAPWPAEADNSGLSLQRMSFQLGATNPLSWVAAPPTPGSAPPVGLLDADNDGLADGWEETYHLVLGWNDALLDPDGDGLTNLEEFIAGTNPLLAGDALRLRLISAARSTSEITVTLEFEARSNKTYTVSFSATDTVTNWTRLVNVSAAPTNRLLSVIDVSPVSGRQRFYRLASPKLP